MKSQDFIVERTFDRITQNPAVLAGRATIRGLRISVAHIVNLVATGMTPGQIVAELPDLDEEDARELACAAALAQNIHSIGAFARFTKNADREQRKKWADE